MAEENINLRFSHSELESDALIQVIDKGYPLSAFFFSFSKGPPLFGYSVDNCRLKENFWKMAQ